MKYICYSSNQYLVYKLSARQSDLIFFSYFVVHVRHMLHTRYEWEGVVLQVVTLLIGHDTICVVSLTPNSVVQV